MSAREFLDRLQRDGLLEESVIADLRQQLSEASRGVTAESLAKLLVDNGHLTRFQASKLVSEVTAEIEQRRAARAETTEERRAELERKEAAAAAAARRAAEEELLLGPLPEAKSPTGATPPSSTPAGAADDDDIVMLEPAKTPGSPAAAPGARAPASRPSAKQPARSAPPPATPASGGLTPLGPAAAQPPLDELLPPRGERRNVDPLTGAPLTQSGLTPLEPAGPAPLADPAEPLGGTIPTGTPATRKVGKRKKGDNPWDSPLMLVGGGVLIVLIIVSLVLYRSMTRGTASEIFAAAEEDYKAGSYSNAIDKYEKLLKSFPRDETAGTARVKKGMATFRLAAQGARDPVRALAAAKEILPNIEKEPQFHLVRDELASLLPDIARAFAEKARSAQGADAEKYLEGVEAAMELVNNPTYIPTSIRKTQAGVIASVTELVALVRRDIQRDQQLAATVASMRQSAKDGDTRAAYRQRDELVATYPSLEQHPELLKAISEIAQRERDLIMVSHQSVSGTTEDAVPSGDRLVTATRTGKGIPGVSSQAIVVMAQGSAYGLDAASGQLLWRRFVGYDATAAPQRVSDEPEADVVVTNLADNELMRLRTRSGEVVWRVPIGEPFYAPVVWRDRVLLTTASGMVWNIDVASGNSSRQTNLKQPLHVGPGADTKYAHIYQVGQNDNVYVLSPESMECREVYYLGHREGTVASPPVAAVGMLMVAVNAGPDYCLVHPLTLDSDGLNLKPIQDPIRLPGQVITPPLVVGRRLVYTTTVGGIHVLDVNPDKTPPVAQDISPVPPSRSEPVAGFALVDRTKLWYADQRLYLYDIQASQGQLSRRWVEHDGDVFVAPLQRFGDAIVHVRRPANAPGLRVTAVDGETGKNVYWQTDLGVPAVALMADGSNVTALSALGSVFHATEESLTKSVAEATGESRLGSLLFTHALPLPDGRHVMFSPAGRVLLYDPKQPGNEMRMVRLSIPEFTAAAEPLILAGGLLIPQSTGQIALLDLNAGTPQALPFQPKLSAGDSIAWRSPAVIGAEQRELVIADDRQQLYRIGILDSGRPHLQALETVPVEQQPSTPLAWLGEFVFAGAAQSDIDVLIGYRLPRLAAEVTLELKGRIVWGPEVVGDKLLVATDAAGLVAVSSSGQQLWTSKLPQGQPVGAIVDGEHLVLASVDGGLWRVSAADGTLQGQHDVGEPLGSGPIRAGEHYWVAGLDGTLHRIPLFTGQ